MFITRKRHEREKLESFGVNTQLSEAILRHTPQGVFLLDARDKIVPPVSRSLTVLFRRQDFTNLGFERLLKPIVTASTLSLARAHLKSLRSSGALTEAPTSNPLKDVEVRLVNPDGSFDTAYYSFEFNALDAAVEPGAWMVRVTDTTARMQQARELEDLHGQLRLNAEILRALMRMGSARLGGALQRIDAAMSGIASVLKKPAREAEAFRDKLEQTLDEVDRVRRESVSLKFTALEAAARTFEDALHELRNRSTLSGTDFLPLAVKLDEVSSQFSLVRALMTIREPLRDSDADSPGARSADAGTEVMEAPKFVAQMAAAAAAKAAAAAALAAESACAAPPQAAAPAPAPAAPPIPVAAAAAAPAPAAVRVAPAGSLDHTLAALTEVIALENHKSVTLECAGLGAVPAVYQTTIKNIAVQLIRNSVVHGIESAEERVQAGKSARGRLRLEFTPAAEGAMVLLFEDDGRGLDPDQVRQTAIDKGLITPDAAAKLRDRQAIKLIFKSGYTTLPVAPGEAGRGSGLAVVRRYVHQAGGKIALASLLGHETRFKISMPAVPAVSAGVSEERVA
jgi:chemotaxis protein histidine kinase CheA